MNRPFAQDAKREATILQRSLGTGVFGVLAVSIFLDAT
jgi:hypothetical protein